MFPIIYLVMTLVITILPMVASPVETGIGLLMILTSVPVYLILVRWRTKPRWLARVTTDTRPLPISATVRISEAKFQRWHIDAVLGLLDRIRWEVGVVG